MLGGSSGFNNARLSTIPLVLTAPVGVSNGDTLSIEVLVRNACSGSGHNSGTARLWYNGQPIDAGAARDAGSRFDATIGDVDNDYFLRTGLALSTAPGSSRTFVDAVAGPKCSAFHSAGTWSTTLPAGSSPAREAPGTPRGAPPLPRSPERVPDLVRNQAP